MNDEQFLERAHVNPHDDSPEFLEAAATSPERRQVLENLQQFDARLKTGLESVSAPEGLKQTLLNIPEGTLHPDTHDVAANDSFWRRNFQYAAALLVAVGVVALALQAPADPMEAMVFNHIYSEMDFLDVDSHLALADVNAVMSGRVGKEFFTNASMENLDISVTEDCWVDIENGVQGVHMVVQGTMGQVTVMVIPSTPVESEISISDERFEGMISPTPGGNLVVVGEKQESILELSNMLAGNINW